MSNYHQSTEDNNVFIKHVDRDFIVINLDKGNNTPMLNISQGFMSIDSFIKAFIGVIGSTSKFNSKQLLDNKILIRDLFWIPYKGRYNLAKKDKYILIMNMILTIIFSGNTILMNFYQTGLYTGPFLSCLLYSLNIFIIYKTKSLTETIILASSMFLTLASFCDLTVNASIDKPFYVMIFVELWKSSLDHKDIREGRLTFDEFVHDLNYNLCNRAYILVSLVSYIVNALIR